MTLTTRAGKGSALTHTEMDNNLSGIISDYDVSGTPTTIDVSLNSGYLYYIVDLQNIRPTSTGGLYMRIMQDSTLRSASSYAYNVWYNAPDGTNNWTSQSSSFAYVSSGQGVGSAYAEGLSASIKFSNFDGANYPQGSYMSGVHRDYYGGGRVHTMWYQTNWAYRSSDTYNKVRFYWSNGTTFQNQGSIRTYGFGKV